MLFLVGLKVDKEIIIVIHRLNKLRGCLVYLWSIMWACWLTMNTIYRRECNRCLTQLHVLGWCWLPCRNDHLNHLCIMSWLFGILLHKHCTPSRTPLMSIHAPYRLAGERGGTRGAGGEPGAGTSGRTRARRRGAGVPGPQTEHVWERQAPEHSKPPYSR